MLQNIIIPAISLGISATTVPGPFQAYLLNVTLKHGWRRGLFVIFAPLIVDGPIIFITVFVLQQIPDWVIQLIRVGGGLLLLWIAWGAWQQLQAGVNFTADSDNLKNDASPRKVLATACAMNALSPGPYLFWSTVLGPLLLEALDISLWAGLAMLLSFYVTFLLGLATLVFLFNRLGKIDAAVTRTILVITIGLLLWFSAQLIIADALGLVVVHQLLTLLIIIAVVSYLVWSSRQNNSQEPT